MIESAVSMTCLAPLALLLVLAGAAAVGHRLRERVAGLLTAAALLTALLAALVASAAYLVASDVPSVISYGSWFGTEGTSFAVELAVDGMSLGFVVLALALCNVVVAFSFRYLHREPGFRRYFVQLAMFVLGIVLVSLAGSIEVLYVGWELLGLSSALLVGFFHERRQPVRSALHVFAVYRVSDAAMLSAAVVVHHLSGTGDLVQLFAGSRVDLGLSAGEVFGISMLLLLAVAGKSALWPLSGWLPRAMEGPTPSSAVYYGALSIHAGCYLLLRAEPLISQSMEARVVVGVLGGATAIYAAITRKVQTDIKSVLAFAALAQVGIIVVEIALGLRLLAFLHIVGHACFRLLQFLSAPNILHDLHGLEHRTHGGVVAAPSRGHRAVYLFALERGFVDALVEVGVVRPFQTVARFCDGIDRKLAGSPDEPQGR